MLEQVSSVSSSPDSLKYGKHRLLPRWHEHWRASEGIVTSLVLKFLSVGVDGNDPARLIQSTMMSHEKEKFRRGRSEGFLDIEIRRRHGRGRN